MEYSAFRIPPSAFILLAACLVPTASHAQDVVVGSKVFTESVVLGEVAVQRARVAGIEARHRRELGGTRILWGALLAGDLDAYPEYSGTLRQELFAGADLPTREALADTLRALGLGMTPALGFNNTYALGMAETRAEALGIRTLGDLARHPDLKLGFSNEFMDRGDGWPALRAAYGFSHADVRGLSHDLAYRALESGALDVMDLYSTDAEIAYYGLRVLEDDGQHFPRYDAVLLYRLDAPEAARRAWDALGGALDEATMTRLNAEVKLERRGEAEVAAGWLTARFGEAAPSEARGLAGRLWRRTREHLALVLISLLAAALVAIPLGILAARLDAHPAGRGGRGILGAVDVIYTIPSLALLAFMIPLFGIGAVPALVALFLYSLMPLVRGTYTGLTTLDPRLMESAEALGLPPRVKLLRIDLPLASRSILAGLQTAAVINIGTATLGALIGAGGYGQPILTGIRLDDTALILEGALPAALLALAAQGGFALLGRVVVPEGLRV